MEIKKKVAKELYKTSLAYHEMKIAKHKMKIAYARDRFIKRVK